MHACAPSPEALAAARRLRNALPVSRLHLLLDDEPQRLRARLTARDLLPRQPIGTHVIVTVGQYAGTCAWVAGGSCGETLLVSAEGRRWKVATSRVRPTGSAEPMPQRRTRANKWRLVAGMTVRITSGKWRGGVGTFVAMNSGDSAYVLLGGRRVLIQAVAIRIVEAAA